MTFYSAFVEACKTPLLWGYEISEKNLIAVRDYGGFLDDIGEENYHIEAKNLFGCIELYTSGAKRSAGIKTRIRKREKDLKIFDKFIDMLEDENRYYSKVKDEIIAKELLDATIKLKEIVREENKCSYSTEALFDKTRIDKHLHDLVEKYNIKNATAKIHNLKKHINQ